MRQTIVHQLPLVPWIDHRHSHELARLSKLLDRLPPDVLQEVEADLCGGARSDYGRRGLAADQVLRVLVVKQLTGVSYERLSFTLDDSMTYRAFCRLSPAQDAPKKSTLQENIKRLRPETLEKVHHAIVDLGLSLGVETGQRVGVDSTAIEAKIHHPTDSSLLLDCVEKMTSLMQRGSQFAPIRFSDHTKRAKRRALEIANAKSMKERAPLYRNLLRTVGFCLEYAEQAVAVLKGDPGPQAQGFIATLEHYLPLVRTVCDQTFRRVMLGEQVPPSEKVVSIFEPHTDIIIKDNRKTIYGHKAFLTIGSSGLVLDLHIPRGNPADTLFAEPMIGGLAVHHELTPREVAFDGGFASHANFESLKKAGVGAVVFTTPRGLSVEQMAGTKQRFQALRGFRASIEGAIGWLKDTFGLRRCPWRGFDSFQSYSWASVLSLNLLVIARRLPGG